MGWCLLVLSEYVTRFRLSGAALGVVGSRLTYFYMSKRHYSKRSDSGAFLCNWSRRSYFAITTTLGKMKANTTHYLPWSFNQPHQNFHDLINYGVETNIQYKFTLSSCSSQYGGRYLTSLWIVILNTFQRGNMRNTSKFTLDTTINPTVQRLI